jgi:hypothetical protein
MTLYNIKTTIASTKNTIEKANVETDEEKPSGSNPVPVVGRTVDGSTSKTVTSSG